MPQVLQMRHNAEFQMPNASLRSRYDGYNSLDSTQAVAFRFVIFVHAVKQYYCKFMEEISKHMKRSDRLESRTQVRGNGC
ncbi:hypothetical protein BCON_0040g00310 [Botryotinia convoluta]|uniref:Uncharacterized protein n=1 Tax=Botryotinia convoluta TaxID=54673 RepID=A0A4Z1IEL6_9HELO|nr:hypothetical protein BCON_0040g00310 [Botryotinia convoluta]